MTATTFDSLGYFEKLKEAGFTEEQARVQANAMRDLLQGLRHAVETAGAARSALPHACRAESLRAEQQYFSRRVALLENVLRLLLTLSLLFLFLPLP